LRTEAALRAALGPTVPKTAAASALGVTRAALERWIERGNIPVATAPGSTRRRLEADALIELLDRVETRRDRGRRGRLLEASIRPPRAAG
jgi:excisionase family DNA binding protein